MRQALLVLASVAAGCVFGPAARRFDPAVSPRGVRLEALLLKSQPREVRGELRGELLEVRPEGLLVMGGVTRVFEEGTQRVKVRGPEEKPHLVLMPFDGAQSVSFAGLGKCCGLEQGRPPTEAVRERLRLVSRFPQGLAEAHLQRLLESCGQSAVTRLGP